MDLDEYQRQASATDTARTAASVYGLVGEVGSVLSAFKKRISLRGRYSTFEGELVEELGDALWYLSSIASHSKLSLNAIAERNLQKTKALYDEGQSRWFDQTYPPAEQFPRSFTVQFEETEVGSRNRVVVRVSTNGVTIGDSLTDNTYDPDGYRFHDAFHLAYVAILGWSPVTRALLRRKRKSNPVVDENEDGARAIAVEEAISIFIFNRARESDYFEGRRFIETSFLSPLRGLVAQLEVRVCTVREWERAILEGYRVFRLLLQNRSGTVLLDLAERKIEFHPPRR